MDEMSEQGALAWKPTFMTYVALAAILFAYPAARMAVSYLGLFESGGARQDWWSFWAVVMIGHWLVAGLCAAAIASEGGGWRTIGLDWSLFRRMRYIFILVLIASVAAAIYAPGFFYGDAPPVRPQSHPLGPVTAAQRVFWIGMAVTAGVVEEIIYRGYAITRLRVFAGLPIALLAPAISFALMHGPSAFIPPFLILYLVAALVFSGTFLVFRSRRLELIILIHILLDLILIGAP